MGRRVRDSAVITIPSDPAFLCVVRAAAAKVAGICGLSEGEAQDIQLGVDEACSNVIKYAYRGDASRRIVVRFRISPGDLAVLLEDDGAKASPDCLKGRDLDDVRPGGLGAHLIRRAFDVVEFDIRKKKGNRLKLVRHLRNGDEDRNKGT